MGLDFRRTVFAQSPALAGSGIADPLPALQRRAASAPSPAAATHDFLRRAFDLAGASVLTLVAAPLMMAIAAVLLILEGRPIFYSQLRVGRDGRPFRLVKFRTMRTDAEADGQARWASERDPRVTSTGRFLRRARLDELPQLLNVIRGQMSLIGPRPERPEFVGLLSRQLPGYGQRHAVKPGITGWAQVRGSYTASVEDAEEKLRFDLYYLRHRSLGLDLRILFETVFVVVSGRGAR